MLSKIISDVDAFVWGPVMLVLLVGTGILLTIRCNFLTWRNLPWAIKKTLSKESRTKNRGEGDVSPFSALTTALAATIGTGNIVGVATAMVSGGAGALVWMWISACFGLSSKFSECMLAIKYREVNEKGEMSGGPMYTMKKALKNKSLEPHLDGCLLICRDRILWNWKYDTGKFYFRCTAYNISYPDMDHWNCDHSAGLY